IHTWCSSISSCPIQHRNRPAAASVRQAAELAGSWARVFPEPRQIWTLSAGVLLTPLIHPVEHRRVPPAHQSRSPHQESVDADGHHPKRTDEQHRQWDDRGLVMPPRRHQAWQLEEDLLDHSPAAHVRRPTVDYQSHATGQERRSVRAQGAYPMSQIRARMRRGRPVMAGDWPQNSGKTSRPVPGGLDTSVPHIARVYDYWLGGKDNSAADREAAEQVIAAYPGILRDVRAQRAFLANAVRYLAGVVGIRQFLDIGTGIPTASNTHEVAQGEAPEWSTSTTIPWCLPTPVRCWSAPPPRPPTSMPTCATPARCWRRRPGCWTSPSRSRSC